MSGLSCSALVLLSDVLNAPPVDPTVMDSFAVCPSHDIKYDMHVALCLIIPLNLGQ